MHFLEEHFELLTRENGNAALLKELILQLAVQGKLVEQDTKDEPADKLLQRIKNDNVDLINKKKRINFLRKNLISFYDNREIIPKSWSWVSFGDIIHLKTGATPSTNVPIYWGGKIKWLKSGDVSQGIIYDCEGRITEKGMQNSNCKLLPVDSVLIALNGQGKTRGTSALLKVEAACNQSLVALISVDKNLILPEYIQTFLKANYMNIRNITGHEKRRGLNMNLISRFVLPLPPTNEQMRIIARVESLLAKVDELDKANQKARQQKKELGKSLLYYLMQAENHRETQHFWHLIENNFVNVFNDIDNIKELRKTCLQLAVQGKLVKQNLEDEPASKLLEKIKAAKERLIKEGKIKKEKPLPAITENEVPFALPEGWVWCRLGEIIELVSGQHITTDQYSDKPIGDPYLTGPSDFGKLHPVFSKWTKHPKVLAIKDDILITVKGSGVGKLNILHENNVAIGRQLMAIRSLLIERSYLFKFLEGDYESLQNQKIGMAIPGISREDILEKLFPLPPLKEQKRIVEKVDRLMALCDRMEEKVARSEELVEGMMESLTNHQNK